MSLSLTHTNTHSLSLSLSLSLTHTYYLSLSLSLSHAHTHIRTVWVTKSSRFLLFYKDGIYSRNGTGTVGTRHGPFNVRSTVN